MSSLSVRERIYILEKTACPIYRNITWDENFVLIACALKTTVNEVKNVIREARDFILDKSETEGRNIEKLAISLESQFIMRLNPAKALVQRMLNRELDEV